MYAFCCMRKGGLIMDGTIVRIESIEIRNFKNVGYGRLEFGHSQKGEKASILGLYGQNGSGKTALIDALELLRLALCGSPVPPCCADYINVDSEYATLKYGFTINNHKRGFVYSVSYEVSFRRELDHTGHNTGQPTPEGNYKTVLFDEVLSCSCEFKGKKFRFAPVIDTRTSEDIVFLPASKYQAIIGKDEEALRNLLFAKQFTRTTSRSFIFSNELLSIARQNCTDDRHLFLMESLVYFGNCRFFVIGTVTSGLISLNALPLAFNYADKSQMSTGNILLKLNEPSLIPERAFNVVHKVIDCMNVVLQQLVPKLTISVRDLGAELSPNGTVRRRIQLVSNKNSREIPLSCESEGIKKLISILQLLIEIYNKPTMTVAIDELDSGVFEYLLGELLRIIAAKGKGQLVFTSHNLRPLEVLDKRFIAFTTTNPQNRYIRLSNVKSTNNLRDFYYRDIVLGEQSEPVYDMTNNSEIAMAFREAGDPDAS